MKEPTLIIAATLAHATLAAALLLLAGSDVAATQLALRTTARISFVWFMLAFVASPWQQLRPGRVSAWLVRRRRALGVIFGLSMAIHVGFILRLYALHASARPPMVTDADFIVGVPGLVLVALLTLTSMDALRRGLGPLAWKRLHTTGIWVVWSIFFLCLIDSVGRKTTAHPVLAYHSFIAVLLFGMGLRITAARRRVAIRRRTHVRTIAAAMVLLWALSGTTAANASDSQTITVAVRCYDVGRAALVSLPGVEHVENGWRGREEVNVVRYDGSRITAARIEEALRRAGTYLRTISPGQ